MAALILIARGPAKKSGWSLWSGPYRNRLSRLLSQSPGVSTNPGPAPAGPRPHRQEPVSSIPFGDHDRRGVDEARSRGIVGASFVGRAPISGRRARKPYVFVLAEKMGGPSADAARFESNAHPPGACVGTTTMLHWGGPSQAQSLVPGGARWQVQSLDASGCGCNGAPYLVGYEGVGPEIVLSAPKAGPLYHVKGLGIRTCGC